MRFRRGFFLQCLESHRAAFRRDRLYHFDLAGGVWFLSRRWAARNVNFHRVNLAALVMIVAGLLLTFPPVMDLLQGDRVLDRDSAGAPA